MENNLKQDLKSLKIVHSGLILGVLFFIVISIYLNLTVGAFATEDPNFTMYLLIAANIFSIAAILAGQFIFRKKIRSINKKETSNKLADYRSAMIVRSATFEGPCFFFIVGFMLTGSWVFLIEATAGLLLMTMFYPTNNRIANELGMDVRKFKP